MSNGPMEVISPFVLRAIACGMEEMQSPQAWADRCRAAAAEIEKLRRLVAYLAGTNTDHVRAALAGNPIVCDAIVAEARAALGEKE